MKNNKITLFENGTGLKARTILNEDGSISINAEDVAIGLGWYKEEVKNSKTYTTIRWKRMREFCKEFGFDHEWSKDDYIPESLFYLLAMKANNERALDFQKWLAVDVVPTLRKTGTYSIQQPTQQTSVPFKEQVEAVEVVARILNVNEASKIVMLGKVYEDNNVPCGLLPEYIQSNGKELRSATELLRKFNLGMNVRKFNSLLVEKGYLEEKSRASKSTKSGIKKYKILTEKGLQFGENTVSPYNQKEANPLYYVDRFLELYKLIV